MVIWSSAAESALADCFACGPVPDGGLVLGRGTARLGSLGLVVLEFARFVVVPLARWMGGDVLMYRDASVAPLLDLRSRLKVAMYVPGEMIRSGFTLARSLELTAQ